MAQNTSSVIEPRPKDPNQLLQERFELVSNQAKAPIRQAISQMEEVVLSTITQCSQNQVIMENRQASLDNEVLRLRKLCEDNNIEWKPKVTPPNRAQRRETERKNKKSK